MKPIAKVALSTLLFVTSISAHADFTLDRKFGGTDTAIETVRGSERVKALRLLDDWDKVLKNDISKDNNATMSDSALVLGGYGMGHVTWNGRQYYVRAVVYQSAEQLREYGKKTKPIATLPGGGICALYVHDLNLNKVTALKINLPENHHGTWCNNITGIGAAGKGREGVLVSLSYYLTEAPLAKQPADIGKGWRYMTVLIRFAQQDGKLVLTQDDACFGNPNRLEDIPSARKALNQCEQ